MKMKTRAELFRRWPKTERGQLRRMFMLTIYGFNPYPKCRIPGIDMLFRKDLLRRASRAKYIPCFEQKTKQRKKRRNK